MLGSTESPIQGCEAVKVVKAAVLAKWEGEGIWWAGGTWWVWEGGRWEEKEEGEVGQQLLEWAEDAHFASTNAKGQVVVERLQPTWRDVEGWMNLMRMIRSRKWEKVPVDTRTGLFEGFTLGVGDKRVKVGVDGVEVRGRGMEWFDPGVLRAEWEEGAECPVWEQCVREWGGGDEVWADLLGRMMGYCLVGGREYQRWFLLEGVARGGKSTIMEVLRGLLGRPAFMGTRVLDLAGAHGMDGAQLARVLGVNECHEMESSKGRAVESAIKGAVGQDETPINIKYQRQKRGVVLGCVPIVVANEVPIMPNRGDGMVGKMVVLPFRVSFLGRERLDLGEVLKGERNGIVQWAVRGLQRLMRASPAERWPVPELAREIPREFRMRASPVAAFLEARFQEGGEGDFVRGELIHQEWEEFTRVNRVRDRVAPNFLFVRMREECRWVIWKGRHGGTGERGMKGLRLRVQAEDHA